MRLHTHTEPGGKVLNEDYLIARRHPQSPAGYIRLLADGQGGQSNGARAAKAACETAWRLASECGKNVLQRFSESGRDRHLRRRP